MHYKQSKEILQSIKAANKILINCHEHPDGDSVGGAMAMRMFLLHLNKSVSVICPEGISEDLKFIPNSKVIKPTDFSVIDYQDYDLFLILDTSTWDRACSSKELPLPKIKIIQIDHHTSNSQYGEVNLVDTSKKSNCEIIYSLFDDWKFEINKEVALCLLTGIIADTGSFQFSTPPETLEVAAKLMRIGASKELINLNLFRSMDFENLKIIGEILRSIQMDKSGKFIWSAVSYEFMKKHLVEPNLEFVDILLQGTKGVEFGIRMIEKKKDNLRVSFRARGDFDTSKIALELGGGGHAVASGAMIDGMDFDKAVKKVLSTVKKYIK